MRFNKAKAVRAAEKSLSQGKIQVAIAEYRRIVEQDANDWTALNMLGDLYVRTSQPDEANKLFTRVAEHYRSQGFALKAIAMYKKMLRLHPEDLAASDALAELYRSQGLIVEARAQLLSIADAHTRLNRTHDALDTLRRIADLDPHNPEVRLRVAAGYARENFTDEAAAAYTEAGDRFILRQTPEQALDAYSEALALCPSHAGALAGVLAAHAQLGTSDEAAKIIERIVAEHPHDAELLDLLLRAHTEAGKVASAEQTVLRLAALKPDGIQTRLIEVARLHLKAGDADDAVRLMTNAMEAAPTARRHDELIEILDEVTTRDPAHLNALRLLARIHSWQHDEGALTSVLERIADAARAAGDKEEETQSLLRLYDIAPDSDDYCERLRALGALPEKGDAELVAPTGAVSYDEVPTFESFMIEGNASYAEESATPSHGEFDFSFAASSDANTAGEIVGEKDEPAAAPVFDASASFADLNDELTNATAVAPVADVEGFESNSGYQEIEWGASLDAGSHARPSAATSGGEEARIKALLDRELESVDFYIAQGYTDVARDTLDMLERQYGAHAAIEEYRGKLSGGDETATETIAEHTGFDLASTAESVATTFDDGVSGDISFGELALDNAPPATVNVPVAFDVASSVAPPAIASSAPAFDSSASELDAGLSAIFEEFREAVETESPADIADYETHYNLGIAYQEMGLLDEAVEEFQKAANIAAPLDGTPRYLQCCNMLGHCFMEKRLPQLAVMWFRKGLDAPGHTQDEYQALRYELGTAYDAAGEQDRALTTFMEVYGVDVSYRGVTDKLRELRARTEVLS